MKTIKKIKITSDVMKITIPLFAPILNAGIENNELYIYVLWEDNIIEEQIVTIYSYMTNETLLFNFGKYLNTVSTSKGTIHIFEVRITE